MATNPWDFLSLPATLNTVLFNGTNIYAAGLMVTAFLCMMLVLPAMFAKQGPDVIIGLMIFGVLVSTALGWLYVGFTVVIIFLIAIAWAGVFRKSIAG